MRLLGPRVGALDTRSAKPPPKTPDPELLTPQHAAFRAEVLRRSGYRCEWVERGVRCGHAAPTHRLIADHKIERRDGGAKFDPNNGQCLCVQHNTLKGVRARSARTSG